MTTHSTTTPGASGLRARFRRSTDDRMVAGVAAGLADYLGADVTVVRVAFAAFCLLGGAGIPLYLAAWLLVPEQGAEHSIAEELLGRVDAR